MSNTAMSRSVGCATALAAFFIWGCGLPASTTMATQAPAVQGPSTFDPWAQSPQKRNRDLKWEGYRREVLKGAPEVAALVDAYESLVLTNVSLTQLPVTLPNTRPSELFTVDEVEGFLGALPPADEARVRDTIAEAQRRAVDPKTAAFMRQSGFDIREPDRLLLYNPGEICWGPDLISMVAEKERLAIETKLDVRSLTDQALFDAINGGLDEGNSLPTRIRSLVDDEFTRLKKAAARWCGPAKDGMPEVRLLFYTPVKTGLWLDVDAPDGVNGAKEVRISPPLVRALFVQTVRQIAPSIIHFLQLRSSGAYSQISAERARILLPAMTKEVQDVAFCFQRSVSFGIAHELAHAWHGSEREEDADEAAWTLLEEVYGDPWLGFFDSLLLRAVLEDAPETWAMSHPEAAALRSRLELLRSRFPVRGPVARRCERSPYAEGYLVTDYYQTALGCIDAFEPKAQWCGLLAWDGDWVEHGSYQSWYPGPGQRLQSIGSYNLGTKTGDWYYWSEDGFLTRRERFNEGALVEASNHDLIEPDQRFPPCPEVPPR